MVVGQDPTLPPSLPPSLPPLIPAGDQVVGSLGVATAVFPADRGGGGGGGGGGGSGGGGGGGEHGAVWCHGDADLGVRGKEGGREGGREGGE